jgi:hypothetical protein
MKWKGIKEQITMRQIIELMQYSSPIIIPSFVFIQKKCEDKSL